MTTGKAYENRMRRMAERQGLRLEKCRRRDPWEERKARLMGLDAPTQRAVDVITHDMFMEAIADLEADVARKEAELGAATP